MSEAQVSFVYALPVSPTAKAVLFRVAGWLLNGHMAKPSQEWLGRRLGRSRRTIIRAIQELEAAGVLRKVRRGWGRTNLYFLSKRVWRRLAGRRRLRDFRRPEKSAQRPNMREGGGMVPVGAVLAGYFPSDSPTEARSRGGEG